MYWQAFPALPNVHRSPTSTAYHVIACPGMPHRLPFLTMFQLIPVQACLPLASYASALPCLNYARRPIRIFNANCFYPKMCEMFELVHANCFGAHGYVHDYYLACILNIRHYSDNFLLSPLIPCVRKKRIAQYGHHSLANFDFQRSSTLHLFTRSTAPSTLTLCSDDLPTPATTSVS